jgi:hypothetical protein
LPCTGSLCAVCTQTYAQQLPTGFVLTGAAVLEGTEKTITVTDTGGVLVLSNVTIKSTGNSTFGLGNAARYALWLQRSTDNFVTDATNIYRIEEGAASGTNVVQNPPTLATGTSNSAIIYPDMGLQPGHLLLPHSVSRFAWLQQRATGIFARPFYGTHACERITHISSVGRLY